MLRQTVVLLAAAGICLAQNPFEWRGTVAPGNTLEIRNINGRIRAELAAGGEIQVTADKHARRSNPDEVRIEVVPNAGGVTICAVYPTPADASQPNECKPGGGHMNTKNNDVEVNFTVHVPAGVRLVAASVNGAVEARGLRGEVDASTVNGRIELSTSGNAQAKTVNGSIRATIGNADWTEPRRFHTVNGSIEVELPAGLNAEVKAETVNGNISTDFPLTIHGKFTSRRLNGVIGAGGRELDLKTVNGTITLRKS